MTTFRFQGIFALFIVHVRIPDGPGSLAVQAGPIKVGLTLSTSEPGPTYSSQYPPCMSSSQQILTNLYVDYFASKGPCCTPNGAVIHTYHSTSGGIDPRQTICVRMPYICKVAQHSGRAGKFFDGGAGMLNTFYKMITGSGDALVPPTSRSSPTASPRLGSLWNFAASLTNTLDCKGSSGRAPSGCSETRNMCETEQDVVFPVVGRSAFRNASVTILQEYPTLIQPIFYSKCRSIQPQLVYGKCVQEFLPVNMFVQPSTPGSVLAQDFVMVESGCRAVIDIAAPQWKGTLPSSSPFPDGGHKRHESVGNSRVLSRRFSRG